MKKIVLFLILFVGFLTGSSYSYTFESEIDPRVISEWEMVNTETDGTVLSVSVKNPNQNEDIKFAMLLVIPPGYILAYCYLSKECKLQHFILNETQDGYVRKDPPSEEVKEYLLKKLNDLCGNKNI